MPASALDDFVSSLAHRIASFPAAGHVAVKDRVNAIALAPAQDFRRDFANTVLDLLLNKHGIHQRVVIGLIAHTCVEATVRFAADLGYQVTVVKDAIASYSDKEMHAALDANTPVRL